jgi:hypothetical protein
MYRRIAIGLLAGLAMPLGLAAAVATPAQAAEPDRYGFALWEGAGQPTNAVPAGTTVTVLGANRFLVRFPGQAARGGVAHVSATNSGPVWCQVAAFGPSGLDEVVFVQCHKAGGTPLATGFSVSFSSSSNTPLLPKPGDFGYIDSYPDGSLNSQYNSAGLSNVVAHAAVGVWSVRFPGLGTPGSRAGSVLATAVNSLIPVRCKVGNWASDVAGQTVRVLCHDATGAPVDTRFHLTFQYQRGYYGGQNPPRFFGYAWFPGTDGGSPETNFNSVLGTGGNRILVSSSGIAIVELPQLHTQPDSVQLTGFGPTADFCTMAGWANIGTFTIVRAIRCFTNEGGPTRTSFVASYSSSL